MSASTSRMIIMFIYIMWSLTLLRSIIIIMSSKIFKKAAKGEKYAYYPLLNLFSMLEIADISSFWGILLFIPGVNLIVLFFMSKKLGDVFSVDFMFKIGLICLPILFYPLLGGSKYIYKLIDDEYFRALDDARPDDINLMTQAEINALNNTPEPEDNAPKVDSIFKSDIDMMEKVAPYKAAKIDLLGMEKLNNNVQEEDDIFKPIERIEPGPNSPYINTDDNNKNS